jgi:hypothetical protein
MDASLHDTRRFRKWLILRNFQHEHVKEAKRCTDRPCGAASLEGEAAILCEISLSRRPCWPWLTAASETPRGVTKASLIRGKDGPDASNG